MLLCRGCCSFFFFFFQAEDGIRDYKVTGVQTCALPISLRGGRRRHAVPRRGCGGAVGHPGQVVAGAAGARIPADRRDAHDQRDRKSVVEGKSGDLGGRRIIKKKKKENEQEISDEEERK